MATDDGEDPDKPVIPSTEAPARKSMAHGLYTPEHMKAITEASVRTNSRRHHDRMVKWVAAYNEAYKEIAHFNDSTEIMCKRLKVSRDTLVKIQSAAGRTLMDARRAARLAAGAEGRPRVEHPKRPMCLRWSILQLFDTLMGHFRVAADDDPKTETQDGGTDWRGTWTAWRVFLAAAFGCLLLELAQDNRMDGDSDAPYSSAEMPSYPGIPDHEKVPRGAAALEPRSTAQRIFEACTGRLTWPTRQARIVSLIVGRRGGKSYITAIIGIYLALCREYTLSLGTKGMVMILARDREQAGVIRGYVLAFLKTPPLIGFLNGEPTQKLIELNNGITIEIRSVSEAGTRGYTVVAALMDEIAFWPTDTNSAKQDKKVLRALRPAMLGIKDAMVVMLSSPYAKKGELYENWKRSYGKDDDHRHLVWQADTLSMRPSDDPDLIEEIRAEYEEDPENAKAEYGAQFRSDLESIFSRKAVEQVCVGGRVEMARSDAREPYRGFVDPSGGSADSYVLAIAHDELRTIAGEQVQIPVLDRLREWAAPFDPEEVSKQVVEECRKYGISQVQGDAYGGEWPRESLRKRGVEYVLCDMNRSELYIAFVPIINSGRCELLDADMHKVMVNQLSNLERRTGRTGKDAVDHPPGSHDDVANAVAGVMIGTPSEWVQLTGFVW